MFNILHAVNAQIDRIINIRNCLRMWYASINHDYFNYLTAYSLSYRASTNSLKYLDKMTCSANEPTATPYDFCTVFMPKYFVI